MACTRTSALCEVARRSSCASREGRPPAGERSKCESKAQCVRGQNAKRARIKSGGRSRRGPHVRRKPASGGPPARAAKRARRDVLRRTTAGQQEPRSPFGGGRGSLPRTFGVLGDAASWVPLGVVGPSASLCSSRAGSDCARLFRLGVGAQPRPPPKAGSVASRYGLRVLADAASSSP